MHDLQSWFFGVFLRRCDHTKRQVMNEFFFRKTQMPIWVFPKIMVPPKSSILIGFSIIFTIHFWVPLFLETPIPCLDNDIWMIQQVLMILLFAAHENRLKSISVNSSR